MKRTITRTVFSEKKCFEEPSRVSEMPFGRAAIGHCLKLKILDLQRLTKFFRLLANTPIVFETRWAQHEITSGSLIASVRRVTPIHEIEQDFSAGQSMSQSLVKASCRIDCGDRCAKLVAGNQHRGSANLLRNSGQVFRVIHEERVD